MTRKYKPVPGCPDELKPIIYGVNLLPSNALKLVKQVARLARDVNKSAFMETWAERDELQSKFEAIVGNKKLSDLLIGEGKILRINQADQTLRDLEQSKRILHYIAKRNHQKREQIKVDALDLLKDYFELTDLRKPPNFVVFFNYDNEKGLPMIKKPPLLMLIEKGNIESFERIAVCPICSKVYWSKKTNSGTCGEKKCAINLANRKRLDKAKMVRETQLIKGDEK
jgi:hypothetical protein